MQNKIKTENHIEEIISYLYYNEHKNWEEQINYLYDTKINHIFKNLFILKNKEKLQKLVNHYDDNDDHLLIKISDCECWGVSGNYDFFDLEELNWDFKDENELHKYRTNKEYAEENPHKFLAITLEKIIDGLYYNEEK